jgi:penicillin-binding protein 2A
MVETINNSNTIAQAYVQLVIKELVTELDLTEADLFRKGYTIQSNLDSKIQTDLIQVFSNNELFPEHTNTFIEAGMAIIDYQSGGITGIVGGRNYHTSTFNRAIDTTRQPASTFKPLFVYGPAIDLGWEADDKLNDSPMTLGDFTPKNYDYKYRGGVTLNESLTMSYNVPTAWLLNEIGLETGLEYIDKFDLFNLKPEEGFKLAMGYTDIGTSPLELSKAFSVFPNDGVFKEASTINTVITSYGKVVFEPSSKETKIYEKNTGKIMTSLLKEVVKVGTGKEAQVDGKKIAGKTGTTSYDGWFVGYDDRYVGAVWLGPDEVIPENRMNIDGSGYPATIFQMVFSELND